MDFTIQVNENFICFEDYVRFINELKQLSLKYKEFIEIY